MEKKAWYKTKLNTDWGEKTKQNVNEQVKLSQNKINEDHFIVVVIQRHRKIHEKFMLWIMTALDTILSYGAAIVKLSVSTRDVSAKFGSQSESVTRATPLSWKS